MRSADLRLQVWKGQIRTREGDMMAERGIEREADSIKGRDNKRVAHIRLLFSTDRDVEGLQ